MNAVIYEKKYKAEINSLKTKSENFEHSEYAKAKAAHKEDANRTNIDRLAIATSKLEQYKEDVMREEAKSKRAAKLREAATKTNNAKEL